VPELMKNSFYGKISLNIKTPKIIKMLTSMDYLIMLNKLLMKTEITTISKPKLLTMLPQFQLEMLLLLLLLIKTILIKEFKLKTQLIMNSKKKTWDKKVETHENK
jgi:hypothetical protein